LGVWVRDVGIVSCAKAGTAAAKLAVSTTARIPNFFNIPLLCKRATKREVFWQVEAGVASTKWRM